jgi:hypothetical protein
VEEIKLKTLGRLIERCWNCAEVKTAESVIEKYHAPNEEQLTFLFASELRTQVADASSTHKVEKAFLEDLNASIPNLDVDAARFRGLLARVNFHGRQHEGRRSASDLGIVISRPVIRYEPYGMRVEVRLDHAIGLLAQAKLGRAANPAESIHDWGHLTDSQERLLPKLRGYYSLLLYRLSGQNDLKPFKWQLCSGHTVREVKGWLASGTFPQETSSSDTIQKLFAGSIGTKDAAVIRTIINASSSDGRFIDIQIFWPDDAAPPPSVNLSRHTQQAQLIMQHVNR